MFISVSAVVETYIKDYKFKFGTKIKEKFNKFFFNFGNEYSEPCTSLCNVSDVDSLDGFAVRFMKRISFTPFWKNMIMRFRVFHWFSWCLSPIYGKVKVLHKIFKRAWHMNDDNILELDNTYVKEMNL